MHIALLYLFIAFHVPITSVVKMKLMQIILFAPVVNITDANEAKQ